MKTSLKQNYQQQVIAGHIEHDPAQWLALDHLQKLLDRLILHHTGLRGCLSQRWCWCRTAVPGLYLWGGVGVGKTYLMDRLFDQLPFVGKQRWHFHAFMQHIHQALRDLTGTSEPLAVLATHIRQKTPVICLDECMVHDIADAMILERLLRALCEQGVTMVMTSNQHPDALYEHGLHRDRFLPAVTRIKQALLIWEVKGESDHRLRAPHQRGQCLIPLSETTRQRMTILFNRLLHDNPVQTVFHIDGRDIQTNGYGDSVIWCDFRILCAIPRSKTDFLKIARTFKTVLLSEIPDFNQVSPVHLIHFIHLIDVLYDHQVRLIISSVHPVSAMTVPNAYASMFQRTQSRLSEMVGLDPAAGAATSDLGEVE